MKRAILTALLSLITLFVFTFGLTGCKNGRDGADGKDGKDGINGIDGADGADGKDGINGIDGKDGENGEDGKDGASVSYAYIDDDGYLILVLTNGKKINCGKVKDGGASLNDSFSYSEIESGEETSGYAVTGFNGAPRSEITIPAVYNGKPVLEIADGAFNGCSLLESVTVPDTVTKIGQKAFYECNNLKSASLGSGLTEIGATAFGGCSALESVYIFDVGGWCEISFENFAANPLYFAHNLYIGNELATEIVIPDGVTRISDFAFYECNNITQVNVGSGAASIGESAFYNCENLKNVTIGGGVTSIGESAFLDCYYLETVSMGGKVESIGAFAFSGCYSLTDMNLPSSLVSIGESAFNECLSMSELTMNEGLETIGDGAFAGCRKLDAFIMPDSVTQIGWGLLMFEASAGFGDPSDATNSLAEIKISDSLKVISDFAFSKSNITTVKVGACVDTICYSAFYGCDLLESAVIPKSVKKIQSYAFYRCPKLESVFYEGTEKEWNKISIGKNGNDISEATKYFYSAAKPEGEGNYWRYVGGVPAKW